MRVFAISDIHGSWNALDNALEYIFKELQFDLTKDKIIFLGDYIDRGPDSYRVLKTIFSLQRILGKGLVTVLKGNHDEMFLAWLKYRYDTLHLANDPMLTTINSFIRDIKPEWNLKFNGTNIIYDENSGMDVTKDAIGLILQNNKDLLNWYKELPYYELVGDTLFVHAGFTEKAGSNWAESSEQEMVWKYPATYGYTPWNKRVVAGHIMTRELHSEYTPQEEKDGIYRNKDHIYIDGAACVTGKLNILMYDVENEIYYNAWDGSIITE